MELVESSSDPHARVQQSRIAADARREAATDREAKELQHLENKKKHMAYKRLSNKKKHRLHKLRMQKIMNAMLTKFGKQEPQLYTFTWECVSSEPLSSETTTEIVLSATSC